MDEPGGLGKTAAGPRYAGHHAGRVTFSRKTEDAYMHPLGRISGVEKSKPCFHGPCKLERVFSPTTRSLVRGQLLGMETASSNQEFRLDLPFAILTCTVTAAPPVVHLHSRQIWSFLLSP